MDESNQTDDLTLNGLQSGLSSQGVGDDQVVTTAAGDFLMIAPPGITIGDIRAFLKGTLVELGDAWDILPDSLPVDGVRLSSLNYSPATTDGPMNLDFTIDWLAARWEMIPGILALASPSIAVQITGKTNPDDQVLVSGEVAGVVEVAQLPIFIEVWLPDGTFQAHLLIQGEPGVAGFKPPDASALLQTFQVGSDTPKGEQKGGIDLGVLTLNDMTVLGAVPSRRVLFHLALSHISLGPGDLDGQLTVDYFGGPESQLSGMVWGQYNIHKKGSETPLFSIMLAAAYDGPGKNWKLEGGAASATADAVTIKDLVEAFSDAEGIPGVLDQLAIKYLHLVYETGPGNFEFQCDVEVEHLFGENARVEMIVDVQLHRMTDANGGPVTYSKTFSGRLLFNLDNGLALEFDLLFDQSPAGTTFIAAYKNPAGGDINIGDLISLIEPDIDVPLSIKLQDAFFVYDSLAAQGTTPARSSYLFGLDIGGGIDLSALPLVGSVLPADSSLTFDLQPLVSLGTPDPANQLYFSQAELARLSGLVPGGGITLPAVDIKEQIELGINIALGAGVTFHFDLPIRLNTQPQKKQLPAPAPAEPPVEAPAEEAPGPAPAPEQPALNPPAESAIETTNKAPAASPATVGTTPPPAGSTAGGIQWLAISKAFGPVQLNRLGLQFEADQKMVWAYLDAGLAVGPLTFTLDGLGMGTPINKLAPQFRLLGIGIDYKTEPLQIGASFLRLRVPEVPAKGGQPGTPAYDEYSGLAIIKTPTIGLSAVGSYSDLPDYSSLFIYAVLNAPIGGPSFFFVTGLAAGFGFNRAITMPEVSAVGQFPLVNMAVGGAGSQPPADPGGRAAYIHDILDQLRGSIYPMKGQYFLAAGIHFTSFELIDSFVLLLVSFGNHFEVDVLGLSTVKVPTPTAGGADVTPIAEVQLALKAVFNPSEGFLSVEAQLTGNSFILDRKCHLTGGFAFYVWFAGAHQGDFVLSLGGYHPDFQKPDHYPTVPRLGLNWQVTPELSIMGGIYFALTPHMVMAGGRLEAVYQSGAFKASFKLAADFLVCWKPYHYDARVSLDIAVDYTFNLFGTHHINASLNAEVHVWGPEFAGHASVYLVCVTFDIDFGAASTPKLEPIAWDEFQQSFLPGDTSKLAHMSVMDGLLRTDQLGEGKQYVVNARDFRLGVDLVVPYCALKIVEKDVEIGQVRTETVRGATRLAAFREMADGSFAADAGDGVIDTGVFGIAPMDRSPSQVTSTFQLAAEMEGTDGTWNPANEHFGFRPVRKRVPRALWGEKLQQDLNGERYVENVLSGIELVPATPPQPGETKWIARDALQFTTTHVEPGIGFEPMTAFQAAAPGADEPAAGNLRDHLTDRATMDNRRDLLTALGFDYDRLGLQLMPGIADALVMAPQIGDLV